MADRHTSNTPPTSPLTTATGTRPPHTWPTRTTDQPNGVPTGPTCDTCRHHDHPLTQCNRFVWRGGAYQQCQCGVSPNQQPTGHHGA